MKVTLAQVGAFWEAFGEDASLISTLTGKAMTTLPDGRVNVGVPYHEILFVTGFLLDKGVTVTLVP